MSADKAKNVAASVRDRLLNLARERKEDFNLLLTRYALERFLYRLSLSSHRKDFVLKGAMLFQIWSETPHRATRDMDFLSRGHTDAPAIEQKIRDICAIDVADDGLTFDVSGLTVSEIREDNDYGGMRARFAAMLGSARIPVQLDFGIGDAITPGPEEITYPTMLDMGLPHILSYPRATVVAEKLEAIVDLGMDNSRMKDFFDLWFIFTTFEDEEQLLARAIKETFTRRGQAIPKTEPAGLSAAFAADTKKREQWAAFTARAAPGAPDLTEVLGFLRRVAMRLFQLART